KDVLRVVGSGCHAHKFFRAAAIRDDRTTKDSLRVSVTVGYPPILIDDGARHAPQMGGRKLEDARIAHDGVDTRRRAHRGADRCRRCRGFPPFPYLREACAAAAGSRIAVGGQDVSEHESGAFTGEVSAAMLRDIGCTFAL